MKKLALLITSVALALSMSPAGADPYPDDPIVFCMPDLDGHCRYCELRFDGKTPSIRCLSH